MFITTQNKYNIFYIIFYAIIILGLSSLIFFFLPDSILFLFSFHQDKTWILLVVVLVICLCVYQISILLETSTEMAKFYTSMFFLLFGILFYKNVSKKLQKDLAENGTVVSATITKEIYIKGDKTNRFKAVFSVQGTNYFISFTGLNKIKAGDTMQVMYSKLYPKNNKILENK